MTLRLLVLTLAALVALPAAAHAITPKQKVALAELKKEPTIREVQEAALGYFRINSERVDSMRSRALAKGAVPIAEVSGGYTKANTDEDTINREFDPNRPWIIRGTGGDAIEARAKLTWDLPKLVFNAEVLDVASLAGLQEGILKEVTRLYYMRRRLQMDRILNPSSDLATQMSKEIRLEELTALLDAMTGGWFNKAIADKGRRAS